MRFLIVAAAVFACAAAAPSGALLATPWAATWGAAPVAVAAGPVSTIPAGDIQGAAIDAQVVASDHVRAAVDQASELQGRAINAAEDHAWGSLNAAQTAQAQVDGAVASVAPNVARSLVAPAAVVAPAVAAYSAPAVVAAPALAAPVVAARAYAAPAVVAAPTVIAGSQSISTQSLTQTHPAPVARVAYAAAPVAYSAAPVAYAAAPVAYGAHGVHAW